MGWRGRSSILLTSLLFLAAEVCRGGEEIQIEDKAVSPSEVEPHLEVQATTRDGPIQAFVISVSFAPSQVEVLAFSPAGDWMAASPPDFVKANGTSTDPGEPGTASLTVVL